MNNTKPKTAARGKLRDLARSYRRTTRDHINILGNLLNGDKVFSHAAVADPYNSRITKMLCKALWRRMRACKREGSRMTAEFIAAREYYACECWLYRQQSAAQRAQISMHGFYNSIAANAR